MANHTKTLTITDTQQKILSNDLFNDTDDNAGIDEWIDGAMTGKINSCWKRFQRDWTQKLMNDPSSPEELQVEYRY